jgi:integrase/recombinase XerD
MPTLAAAPALAAPDQERAAALIQISLGQSERLLDPRSCSPQDHDHGRGGGALRMSPAVVRVTAMISSTVGGSADTAGGWEELEPWPGMRARASRRCLALRHQPHDARPPLVARRGPRRAALRRLPRRGPAPLRADRLRHTHAVEMAREGVPLIVIQRQLGHSNPGITSVYLRGIDRGEIFEIVHARRAPMIPVSASVRL